MAENRELRFKRKGNPDLSLYLKAGARFKLALLVDHFHLPNKSMLAFESSEGNAVAFPNENADSSISVEELQSQCHVASTTYGFRLFDGSPFDWRTVPFRFILSDKEKMNCQPDPSWDDFASWLRERAHLAGYDLTITLECGSSKFDVTNMESFQSALCYFVEHAARGNVQDTGLDVSVAYQKHGLKPFTAFKNTEGVQVREFIEQIAAQAGLVLALCEGQSASRRANMDPLLFGAAAIVASLSGLEREVLKITMEQKMDQLQPTGQIDYTFKMMADILTYMEAKGEMDITGFHGQVIARLAAVRKQNQKTGVINGWDATNDPVNVICSNFLSWEFFSCTPTEEPPVRVRTMTIDTGDLPWQDVKIMTARIRPVLEQLVGILNVEMGRIGGRMHPKRQRIS